MTVAEKQKIWVQGFYHSNSIVNPLPEHLIQELIVNEVFDPNYCEKQNGLRGLYEAELEAIREGWENERVMFRTFLAIDTTLTPYKAIGVATVRLVPRDNPMKKDADFILHVFVKPEYRGQGIGKKLIDHMRAIGNIPGMAMEETELSKPLLKHFRAISPIRRPTELDRNLARCLRTLDPPPLRPKEGDPLDFLPKRTKWVSEDGGLLLCTDTIVETLRAQDAEIKRLRKEISPHDNSITYPS